MPVRKIIQINEELCNGCGDCITACAEAALEIRDGKARLVSEVYCDGLGACLGHCPQGAITIEERPAAEFDEALTEAHVRALHAPAADVQPSWPGPAASHSQRATHAAPGCSNGHGQSGSSDHGHGHGCPGSAHRAIERAPSEPAHSACSGGCNASALQNWPLQLTLVNPAASFLQNADLLLAADCVPFAMADFHQRFLQGRPVIIGCPKLDQAEFYVKKLAQILVTAAPRSLTVVHMEVPCCSGLTRIAQMALAESGADVPLQDVTISIQGDVLAE